MYLETLHPKTKKLFCELGHYQAIQRFHLIGWTALALYLWHRQSIDLDFITYQLLTSQDKEIIKKIKSSYQLVYESHEQFDCYIDDVKITLLSYRRKPLFPIITFQNMLLRDLRDIVTSKANTIWRRCEIKDYLDLYVVLKDQHMTLHDIISLSERRYKGDFSTKLFLKQLLMVDQCEDYQLKILWPKISKSMMNTFFRQQVKDYITKL